MTGGQKRVGQLPAPGSAGAWRLATRPATLWAAVAPFLVGTACAQTIDGFSWGPALAALFGAVLIQIGTNFANDLFDFQKGADTEDRLGPVRAAQAGLLSERQLAWGSFVAFLAATFCGLYLTWVAGWAIVAIGVLSILSGLAYTGGPRPLGYLGLGDVFVFVFFGLVAVTATTYVQAGWIPRTAWLCAAAVGGLSTCILAVNNLRDASTDALVGKRTLAVRCGETFVRFEYVALFLLAFVVPIVLAAWGESAWVLLACAALPMGIPQLRRVLKDNGADLNPALGGTARLLLVYCVLLSIGLVL